MSSVLYVMYPEPPTALINPVKTLVNLVRLVVVEVAAAAVVVLVWVVDVEVDVDNAMASVFVQLCATAFAGPQLLTGLQPGS